ncbi:MAG: rhomboid family intramembrane serine protease [Polyangiaceae bacterium]|nr:rhomboid family intramembrane serine protease [Polyangiaceae bacterium]
MSENNGDQAASSAYSAVPNVPPGVTSPDPETAMELANLSPQGFTAIGPITSERKTRDWSLVLQSIDIWHVVHRTFAGWILLVRNQDYDRASHSIDRYEVENRDWPPRRERERPRHEGTKLAPLIFLALAAFFMITGPVSAGSRWFQRGTSVADLVLASEPWRAVTALTLHADSAHVIGNVISGTIFASAVCSRLGPGGGALAILASGVLGNVANAFWHHSTGGDHASIGASTAVFGAVGLLAATQLAVDRQSSAGANRSWIETAGPIVGGLSLLGALGASPTSDLGAHLFGFLAGVLFGLPAALYLRRRAIPGGRFWVQPLLGALALGVVVGSWQLAMQR